MPIDSLFSTTIEVLSKSVDLRTRNQNLIASNLANVETPGYTAKTLQFEKELQQAVKNTPRIGGASAKAVSHPAHIPIKGGGASIRQVRGTVVETPTSSPGRDGNSVELENEMSKMMQNQVMFNASAQLLSKKFEGIKSALREGK